MDVLLSPIDASGALYFGRKGHEKELRHSASSPFLEHLEYIGKYGVNNRQVSGIDFQPHNSWPGLARCPIRLVRYQLLLQSTVAFIVDVA